MSPLFAFLITLSLIIFVHELGHFLVARWIGVRVERFSLGFGPRLIGLQRGGTDYCLCLFPFGGYVKMAGESFEEDPVPPAAPRNLSEYRARSIGERFSIVVAGPLINYLLGFVLFVFIFIVGAPTLSPKIGGVLEGYPAALGGLQAGDRIISINSQAVGTWEEVTRIIQRQTNSVTFTIERAGKIMNKQIQPMVRESTNLFGVPVRIGRVGITPSDEVQTRRYSMAQAVVKAASKVWMLNVVTVQALWQIATGGMAIKDSFTGPIGIFYLTSSVAKQGLVSLLSLIAVLSTSLGFFNVLPVPVLDGGHLAFLIAEKLKGRPVSLRAQEVMTRLGLGVLTLLLVVVTYNDILKFGIAGRVLSIFGRG